MAPGALANDWYSDTAINDQLFKMWTFDILELGSSRYGKEWPGGH